MKKTGFIFSVLLLMAIQGFSQQRYLREIVVANGGRFGFPDSATLRSVQPFFQRNDVLDKIDVESVQDIEGKNEIIYLAAQDTLIKYDLIKRKRLAKVGLGGIKDLSLAGPYIFAKRFDYAGDSLVTAYDTSDLSVAFVCSNIDKNPGDVIFYNDNFFVAHNRKGKVDQLPPFGVFNDTMGMINIYDDLGNYSQTIDFDTTGAGIEKMFLQGANIFATCHQSGYILNMDAFDFTFSEDFIDVSDAFEVQSGLLLIANSNNMLQEYSLSFKVSNDLFALPGNFTDLSYENIFDQIMITTTDYASFGKLYVYNRLGVATDSFDMDVSSEALYLHYDFNSRFTANEDVVTLTQKTITIDVIANDVDPDGDSLYIESIASSPNLGIAQIQNNAEVKYTVANTEKGRDSFEVRITEFAPDAYTAKSWVKIIIDISSSIQELSIPQVKVFPNPVNNELTIESARVPENVQILDVSGKVVQSISRNNLQSIDVSGLERGAYFIRLTFSDLVLSRPFIKE